MFEANKTRPTIPCFIITDARGLQKYGLGMVRMGTRKIAPYLADGYLVEGATLADLAGKLGMDANMLEETVARMNDFAESGTDTEFGRGTTALSARQWRSCGGHQKSDARANPDGAVLCRSPLSSATSAQRRALSSTSGREL